MSKNEKQVTSAVRQQYIKAKLKELKFDVCDKVDANGDYVAALVSENINESIERLEDKMNMKFYFVSWICLIMVLSNIAALLR